MEKLVDYLKEKDYDYFEHENEGNQFLVTPSFILIKAEENYFISFDIDLDKESAIGLYIDIQNDFLNEIGFGIYYDCIMSFNDISKELEWFYFGQEARNIYYNMIYSNVKEHKSIPKDVTFH